MKTLEFGQFVVCIFLGVTIASVHGTNGCRAQFTCGSCIQFNGTCGWCLSPDYTGGSRCDTKDRLIKNGCLGEEVFQSINSAHLQKNRKAWKKRLLQPQKVTLQLVPNTGYVLPVKAFLLAKNKDQRLGGHVVMSVKAPAPLKVTMKSDCNNNDYTEWNDKIVALARDYHKKGRISFSVTALLLKPPLVMVFTMDRPMLDSHHSAQQQEDKRPPDRKATFSFTILTKSCFPKKKTIYVRANNMKKTQLVITVKAKCECDCELKKPKNNSENYCNGKGKLVCGQCECDRGIYGRQCECAAHGKSEMEQCTRRGDHAVCSGNGECICGVCHCLPDASGNDRFSGRYCSCDRMGCPKFNGSFCGGPERGECHCGQCGCRENYQGRACETTLKSEKCIGSNGKVCGGNGICEQNQCICEKPFYGDTCEEFDDEPTLRKYCIKSGSIDVCSNRGTCVKGSCKCYQAGYLTNQTFKGRFCECDDYRCKEFNGKLCGGFERGTCNCGECRCREGFSGPDCSVSIFTDQCRSKHGKLCNDHGNCVNNRCQCQFGYTGRTCEQYKGLHRNLTRYCIESGKTDVCSNRGRCEQGRCICNQSRHGNGKHYTGTYCECDDNACQQYNGKICGGYTRGLCSCGICLCRPGLFGPDCSTVEDTDKCMSSDGKICSGRGKCVNNNCKCDEGYQGPSCEKLQHTTDEYTPYCIPRDSTEICSNRGICKRGRCQCHRTPNALNGNFTGRYCECDDYSCARVKGKLCGGDDHGKCICGKCRCHKHYSGPKCTDDHSEHRCTSENGTICDDHGKCINGKCECDELYTGPTCEKYDRVLYTRTRPCRKSPGAPVCSRRGICTEGMCECHVRAPHTVQRFSGEYCECDDYNCDYYNGEICGGADRGICVCGKCQCHNGYLGSDCSGSNSTEGCRATNGRLCNGKGVCEHNKCRCVGEYLGPTCEDCPTCPGPCARLKPCVLCRVFGTGSFTFERCIKCEPIILVDSIEKMPASRDGQFCLFLDEADSCRVRFVIERKVGGDLKVTALSRKECPSLN